MNDRQNLSIKDTFNLAIQNHQKNKLNVAQDLYNQILKIDPGHVSTLNNLGIIFKELGELQKAKSCYEKAIEINPNYTDAHNNLGGVFKELGERQKAKSYFEKAIEINPNHINAHFNLGAIFEELGENQKAKNCYEKAIEINPNYINAHNNIGVIFKELGEYQKAKDCFEKVIKIDPNYPLAHNNLGIIFQELGELQNAIKCYKRSIDLDPNFSDAYWNLHSSASNIDEALSILKKSFILDNADNKTKMTISILEGYKGNFDQFNTLLKTPNSSHPFIRSAKWVFSLPKLPNLTFNRGDFFDAVIALSDNSRPFYEFGVWNGVSFQYLINTFKKGFGFDTFTGLPEAWHNQPKGSYSSYKVVPKIEGGEFIVGKFDDTLPDFFSKERPMASLINFDADLYSSTLCALNNSKKVIDEKTILIFDELINNDKWEEDEFKALNEFCDNSCFSYEVIVISFFTKQVAVKLKK